MKKTEKTQITKKKILYAAVEEFAVHGFDGTSINRICKEHGISKGLVYHNFNSKEALYLCCLQEAVDTFISYMQGKEFKTDFRLYMKERYRFFEKYPHYSRLIFGMILTGDTEFTQKIKEIKEKFDSFNIDLYMQAVDSLKLRSGVSREDAIQYYGLLQNMLNNYLSADSSEGKGFDFVINGHEKILQKILDFILYGIAEK
ncbi:MAG: TetR/AcrR family transcriptional regulator [Eubacterium sp.]